MGPLTQQLQSHTRIGLDTSPFIYFAERHPRYFALVQELFTYLTPPEITGVTSIITFIEVSVYPQRQSRLDLVEIYERTLLRSKEIHTLPVTVDIARRAIAVRAEYNLRVPDALEVATALETGATLFVTNDRRFKKVTELEPLILEDVLTPT